MLLFVDLIFADLVCLLFGTGMYSGVYQSSSSANICLLLLLNIITHVDLCSFTGIVCMF